MQMFLLVVKKLSGNLLILNRHVKTGVYPAFTMIELIFVIVIIGILSAVAIPKLAASRDDAVLVKGKSQVAAIRSGIAMQKNKRLIEGVPLSIPPNLDNVTTYNTSDQRLFNYNDGNGSNILEYPIYSRVNHDGSWVKTAANEYKITLSNSSVSFDYNSTTGSFDCDHNAADNTKKENCKELTK